MGSNSKSILRTGDTGIKRKDGNERRATRFSQKAGSLGDYLAAGEGYLYFTWRNDVGDIWVMDVVTDDKE